MFLEICEAFASLNEWQRWEQNFPQLHHEHYIRDMVRSILATGFIDPTFGAIRAQDVEARSHNYRESLTARGATSRYRALLRPAVDYMLANGWCSPVYLAEHASNFGDLAPVRFPYLLRSEYMPDLAVRRAFPYIRHEDPVNLSLPDRAFDIYLAGDTMIYAPSAEAFLREARRVLRRGGLLLATFPFRYGAMDTEVLAELVDGKITHYGPPVLHDDPLDRSRARPVFFIPGWDILDAVRSAGFVSAEIVVQSSRTYAIVGAEIATVFLLRATV